MIMQLLSRDPYTKYKCSQIRYNYFVSHRMHVLSNKAPSMIGPGMAPKILTRSIWRPNAYDRWPGGTLLKWKSGVP